MDFLQQALSASFNLKSIETFFFNYYYYLRARKLETSHGISAAHFSVPNTT